MAEPELPLSETPGLEPPPGSSTNFSIHNELFQILIGTVATCITLTTLAVTARLILRARVDKRLKTEDYTSIACWVGFVTYNGIALAIGATGAGRHQWNVSVASIIRVSKLGNVIEIVYGPTVWLAKLSVLLQYLHIFVTSKRGPIYWSIQLLIWANFFFYLIDTFIIIFSCQPREKIWNFLLPGKCLNINANFVVTGGWNVLSDFCILFLPMYAIWHLKIPLKKKLSVAAVFASGLFACVASIIRLYYSVKLVETEDATFVFLQVALWGLAELATVVLCGSAVIMPKFIQLLRGRSGRPNASKASGNSGQLSDGSNRHRGWFSKGPASSASTTTSDPKLSAARNSNYIPLEDGVGSDRSRGEAHQQPYGLDRKMTN